MSSNESRNEEQAMEKLDGIPVRSETDEFPSDEMLDCVACGRKTPPNRLDCIYCGTAVEVSETEEKLLRPVLRPPEEGEEGYSIVIPANETGWNPDQITLAASMSRVEKEAIGGLSESGCAVPIAYSGSDESVKTAARRLSEAGARTVLFFDDVFETEIPQKRLRGVSIEDDGSLALILFNNDVVERVYDGDIVLIVLGIVLENRIEADEKHKRKGLDKILNTTEVSADEIYIDLYTGESAVAFRIQASGFDFSFLGAEKDMLAVKNLDKTIKKLREFASAAVFVDQYPQIRSHLDKIWTLQERTDTKRIKRRGFGSFEKKRVVTSSNTEQFTRFSRLQWLMLKAQIDAERNEKE